MPILSWGRGQDKIKIKGSRIPILSWGRVRGDRTGTHRRTGWKSFELKFKPVDLLDCYEQSMINDQ